MPGDAGRAMRARQARRACRRSGLLRPQPQRVVRVGCLARMRGASRGAGCAVRLRSGEVGMVMRRGESASTPQVAVMSDRAGGVLAEPLIRDTAQAPHAIAAVIPQAGLKLRVGLEKLIQAMAA